VELYHSQDTQFTNKLGTRFFRFMHVLSLLFVLSRLSV